MSKRSPMLLVFAGGFVVGIEGAVEVTGEAEEKSPNPEPMLSVRVFVLVVVGCVGGEACFSGGAGLESKKEPPLKRSPPDLDEAWRL